MALLATLYTLVLFVCAIAWDPAKQERGGVPAWEGDRNHDRVQTPYHQWHQQQQQHDYRHDWLSGNLTSRRTDASAWNMQGRSNGGRHGSRQQTRQHLHLQQSHSSRSHGDQNQQHHLQYKPQHHKQHHDKKHQKQRTSWRQRDAWNAAIGDKNDGDSSSSSIGEAWRRGGSRQDRPSGQRSPYGRLPQDRHITWSNPRPERKPTSQHREEQRRKNPSHQRHSSISNRQPWHVRDTVQPFDGGDSRRREPGHSLPETSWRTQRYGVNHNSTKHNGDHRNHLNTHINTHNRVAHQGFESLQEALHGSRRTEQKSQGRNKESQQGFGTKRPNIVLIITDDQDVELGSLNYMPKLKRRMRDGGAMLPNAYTSTPMCCPSRSSLLTGMYIHNHEVYTNNQNCSSVRWQQTHERRTFATYLNDAGYRTGYFGKYLNKYNGSHVPAGWREWAGLLMNSKYYNYTVNRNSKKVKYGEHYPQDYYPRVITEDGIEFIRTSKSMASHPPFMMVLSYPAPHGPEDSAPEYSHLFFNATDHHTVAYDYAPNPDKQWILQNTDRMDDIQLKFTDVLMTKRLQTLQSIDDAVERIYEELESFGELNNTYIFYTSDHGYHLGQFGLVKGKSMPFEFDIKVPFFVSGPDVNPGIILPNIALNIDLAPTFLDIAGITVPPHMDGRSLLPLFRHTKSLHKKKQVQIPWRDSFLVESSGRYREDPLSWGKRKLERAKGYSGIGDFRGGAPTLYTSKHERLEIVCKRPEFQSPCKRFQKWECISDGRRWRLQKCRPKRGGRIRNCVCDSSHGMGYLVKLEPEERKKQRAFLNKHATQDVKRYKPKFLKVFNDVDSQEIAETTLMETGFYNFNKNSKRSILHRRDRKGKEQKTPRKPAGCHKGRCKRSTHDIDQETGNIDKSMDTESISGDTISDFINEEELRDIDDQIIEIYGELETLEDKITTTVPPAVSFNVSTVLSPGTNLGITHGCRASDGEVDCMEEVYNNPTTWKSSKAAIDDYIQLLHQQLQVLKNIRQHLREKRPHDNEENEDSNDYIFNNYDSDEDGMESNASGDSLFTIDDIFEFGSGDSKRIPDFEDHEDKLGVTEVPTDAKDIDFFDEIYGEKEFPDYSVEYGDDINNSSEITIDEELGSQITVTESDGEIYFKDYDYNVEDDGISGFGATQETDSRRDDNERSSNLGKKNNYGSGQKHFKQEKAIGQSWSDLSHPRQKTENRNGRPSILESRLTHDLGLKPGKKYSTIPVHHVDHTHDVLHTPSQFHISFTDSENRQDPFENETANGRICWCNRRQAVRLARLAEREKKRLERQQLREARRQRKEKKFRKKTQNNLGQCLIPMLNCYTHDNEHWRTPPLWTDGPFCFCMNAANNTYWCLRTINSTHNFLYCEFITGLVTYYDMNIDPYQLRNVAFTLTTDLLEELHGRLETLRMCVGVDECDSIAKMPQVEPTSNHNSAANIEHRKNENNSIVNGIEGRIDVMSSVTGKGKMKKVHSRESHKNRRRKQKLKNNGYDDSIVYSMESGSPFDLTDSRRHRVRLPRKSKVKKQNRRREKRRERRKKRKERKSALRQRRFYN
ncbi:extracellular sulfatase Sulf1 isoform X2 [Oratosquilla oratoria]|uniref:extracellular sulfatase Sulf1 isoform X2 n=1 Tax=Oratosquilla oratoria TaxID=337810 RepID=UPI003F76B8A7